MAKDLHLVGLRYNIASAIFFVRIYILLGPLLRMADTYLGYVLPRTGPIVSRFMHTLDM